MARAVDLFSGGGGGWCLAARELGIDTIGLEWGAPECATRAVVGLPTIRTDVATYPAERFVGKVEGVMGSPPCQSFSSAGKRKGMADPRGQMVHEPMRYVRTIRPRWVALEQVPEVLIYWRWIARELREMGYSVWTGVLMAADYGVPQCRERAILLASLDRRAEPPAPTHSKHGHADLLGESLLPWVSMAEALGWGATNRPANAIVAKKELAGGSNSRRALKAEQAEGSWRVRTNSGNGYAHDYERSVDRPSMSVTGRSDRWKLLSPGRSYTSKPRVADPTTDPAPTIALGHNVSSWCWVLDTHRGQKPDGSTDTVGFSKPAPTVTAMAGRQWKLETVDKEIRVESWELGVLRGFPADHPWQSPHVSRQIGNAFPPPFALACLRSLVGPV